MTVRLDRVQQGLFEAFSGVAANVVWAQGEVPHEQLSADGDLLSMKITSGPVAGLRRGARGTVLLPADSVVVRVTAATENTRNVLELNDFAYYRDTVGADTPTTIRDALLAAVTAGEENADPAITIAADGADGIALTASELGALRKLRLVGELDIDPPVFSGDAVLELVGTEIYLVSLQAFSKGREPFNGALPIMSKVLGRLQSVDVSEELSRWGVALWDKSGASDLSAIAGAHWESRAALDLTIACRSVSVRPADLIESATATIAIANNGTITVSQAAP